MADGCVLEGVFYFLLAFTIEEAACDGKATVILVLKVLCAGKTNHSM